MIAKTAACAWPIRSRSRKSGSIPRRVVDAALGQLLRDLARPVAVRLDHAHADPLRREHARDRGSDLAAAEDDDVLDRLLARREERAPLARGLRRADHDDPVARLDHVVAAGKRQRVARG